MTLDLQGARVTVMGLGLFGGGVAATRFAAARGARVTVTDQRDAATLAPALRELEGLEVELVLGEHRAADFEGADLVLVNPAVPPTNPWLERARAAGARLSSEVALFLDGCPCPVLAVSGTQGKSSTTNFLAQLLAAEGRRVHLGGNIGRPLLAELDAIGPDDLVALELSSYQLESLPDQWTRAREDSPVVGAALVNVLSDHLERHGTREAYARAKLRLAELLRPGSPLLLPADPLPVPDRPPADLVIQRVPGPELEVRDGEFRLRGEALGRVADSPFQAPFLVHDQLIALGLAALAGVGPGALAAVLPRLRGLPHRLDRVGELDGRPLWDNGVSTTPDSTVSALEALEPRAVVLLGGKVQVLDHGPLFRALRERGARAVVFGAARGAWLEPLRAAGVEAVAAEGPREALDRARELPGTAVLFSPAAASFDAYPNFRARAEELLEHARSLGLTPSGESPADGEGAGGDRFSASGA